MFRSHAPRAVVAALTAVVLIVGLMASTTSAAPKPKPTPTPTPLPTPTPTPLPTPIPTPTPASTNRIVYFGTPETGHDRQLDPSTVTTGGVYVFDVIARNDDNQSLTHPRLAFGEAAEPGGPTTNGLPTGSSIISVDTSGIECVTEVLAADGKSYACDLPNFAAGDSITATFTIQAGNNAVINDLLWLSFKVAEKVSNQGANQNTAFASSPILIQPTDSNRNATFKLSGQNLTLQTGDTPGGGDKQVTKLSVPGGLGGVISIFETNDPTGCSPACIGQEVLANVRDGALLDPYLVWEFRIVGQGAGNNKGGVYHENALGGFDQFVFSNATLCKTADQFNCFELYEVSKQANSTKIIFRSETNGKIRAN